MKAEKLELLSPARTADIGIEAIRHGADAVYIGGPLFSARSAAANSIADIARLCEFAHHYRARVMMALNTILRDSELEAASRLAWQAWDAGVDALIVQDMGLLECDLPPIQLHASTQCDIRTPEKARFLEAAGFSQIVPARELSLAQIEAIHRALTSARIEYFIHGALCVSYSGQCYASEAMRGRSANRGSCAQICRLPFEVRTESGEVLAERSHVLSLKDNDQRSNLEALAAAGVRSFKIEGRLKDMAYVKNVTAYYRKLFDALLDKHPEYARESEGRAVFSFEPDPARSFNRGGTDYFIHGTRGRIWDFETPKNAGQPIGRVRRVGEKSFTVKTREALHNGDGLTFWLENGELSGLLVNRAEELQSGLWEVFTRERPKGIRGLKAGLDLMRNRDTAWSKLMAGDTASRDVPLAVKATVTEKAVRLHLADPEGIEAEALASGRFEPAKNPERAAAQAKASLAKFGGTGFCAASVDIEWDAPRFLPVSILNGLRREAAGLLEQKRREAYRRPERARPEPGARFPEPELDYHANVENEQAVRFYGLHGARVTQMAFEKGGVTGEVELMRCRHCVRYALGLCPKEAKKRGEKIRPEPLYLRSGDIELKAVFHCGPCEMSLLGKRRAPASCP
ncbi:U32 family peptidase [Mesosutterella sp. AGMB02718]|uniref:U32 family peptidase n=1 Tax=Mesosutterella faecium TaxID=2925194 RepID=A0ABT7IP29_9BURK|nr:U32 family peptidase [Mesosutterella sp. AGMB02718]MDL2060134.1 U32 family peptidase [Mesosutterella sp. AGMB02718]